MLIIIAAASAIVAASVPPGCCDTLNPFLESADAAFTTLDGILECKDKNPACASWAKGGECQNNPGFMRQECRVSCNACELSGEDAIAAQEAALLGSRNMHLACKYAKKEPQPPLCHGLEDDIAQLRSRSFSVGGNVEAKLSTISSKRKQELSSVCDYGSSSGGGACSLGERRFLPAELATPQPPPLSGFGDSTIAIGGDDKVLMPRIGLGTWLMTGDACRDMVAAALRAGLRHIDTSENYANHDAIGQAIQASGVPRSELFLADKISFPQSYHRAGVRAWVAQSLKSLGTDYLDLLMLHSVGPTAEARIYAWDAMVELKKDGVLRALGTSNFGRPEMGTLRRDGGIVPATHQIKFNVYHQGMTMNSAAQDFLYDCELGKCVVVAYCPLNSWPSKLAPVDDKLVGHIAKRVGKTPAQVLLRWVVQRGAAALTRSRNETRLREALEVNHFALSEGDMRILSGLAWLVESESNKPPKSVPDVLGAVSSSAGSSEGGDRVEL